MTLDDRVTQCPSDPTVREAIQQAIAQREAQGGPLIMRYYRWEAATRTLHDDTFHATVPLRAIV